MGKHQFRRYRYPRFLRREPAKHLVPALAWWEKVGPVISHWSQLVLAFLQFGTLVLGIVVFYYTVLPLYEKAALEQAIARLKAEYREVKNNRDNLYDEVLKFVMSEFRRRVEHECGNFDKQFEPRSKDNRYIRVNRIPESDQTRGFLDFDIRTCVDWVLESSAPGFYLSEEDVARIEAAVLKWMPKVVDLHRSFRHQLMAVDLEIERGVGSQRAGEKLRAKQTEILANFRKELPIWAEDVSLELFPDGDMYPGPH